VEAHQCLGRVCPKIAHGRLFPLHKDAGFKVLKNSSLQLARKYLRNRRTRDLNKIADMAERLLAVMCTLQHETGHTLEEVGQQVPVTRGEPLALGLDPRGIRQIEAKALREL
jgi:DNA-directed RNA polymerase sigma subunit (sigma70/sigma32)